MTTRKCSVCASTAHDRRTCPRLAGKPRPRNYRKALAGHRRNPESRQLTTSYDASGRRLVNALMKGNAKGEHYWEKVQDRKQKALDDKARPIPHEFMTVTNKYGAHIVVPLRYDLESDDKYRHSEDAKHAATAKRRRDRDKLSRREEEEEALNRSTASHKRKLNYSAEHARMLRERRKREVSVSPTATKKVYEAARAKAEREGKQLVTRERGGGNYAQKAYFARRTGN